MAQRAGRTDLSPAATLSNAIRMCLDYQSTTAFALSSAMVVAGLLSSAELAPVGIDSKVPQHSSLTVRTELIDIDNKSQLQSLAPASRPLRTTRPEAGPHRSEGSLPKVSNRRQFCASTLPVG